MSKKVFCKFVPRCFMILLGVTITALSAQADDVNDFRPIYKLRGDLQCWPTYPNQGNSSGFCRSKNDFKNSKPPVFWEKYQESVNGREHKLITYWVYFGNQNKCSTFGGGHPDDWENITVHLVNNQLTHVTYSQHNGRYTRKASDIERYGNQPIVYFGKYSHGSYHDQRSRCSSDGWCFGTGNYCFYWKDPRGPGETWNPSSLQHLSAVGQNSYFPGSQNPLTRSLPPHEQPVCRVDGGSVIGGIIDGTENTCDRNPSYLKNDSMVLREMFYLNIY